ncbi:MAG: HAMP domain-containing protein, partial [Gemmatimonadetes bacterium]|nr:HAMP domain-containing protein [Gemmatimonadota bacterium]
MSYFAIDILLGIFALGTVLFAVRKAGASLPSIGRLISALVAQSALIVLAFVWFDNSFTASPPSPSDWYLPAIVSLAYFVIRVALLLWMIRYWAALGEGRRSRWQLLAIAAWFYVAYSGNLFVAGVAIFASIAGTNRQRADDLEGRARFGALALSILSLMLLVPIAHEPIVLDVFELGTIDGVIHSSQFAIADSAPGPVRWIAFATRPLANTVLSLLGVLWFANLSLFVRLVVPRIQLKRMRLNPRFNLIYMLMLPVPALLLLVSLFAALYYGAGMNKASIARNLLDEKVDDLVEALAFPAASLRDGKDPSAVVVDWEVARRGEDVFFVRNGEELLAVSGFVAAPLAWGPILPDTLERVGGLYYRDSKLWLGAGVRVDSSRAVEAFRPVDQEFVRHLGDRVAADLMIEARTNLRITNNGLNFSSDLWADSAYAVRTDGYDTTRTQITNAANTYLLIGDWLHDVRGTRGGVALTVQTDPGRIVSEWLGGGAIVYRAGPLIGTMLLIGVLLGIAVNVAVGIGRGLVRGVLGDLARLTEGVERFGRGDFDSRVTIDGQDEVADLSHSFNRMAENIRENQA